jgi:uncharacterized RDD family membrane protein YckC
MLFRDGWRGRSLGKRILGLRVITPKGDHCGWFRSMIRNLFVVLPGLNLVEVVLVVAGRRRLGDLLAHTTITEE